MEYFASTTVEPMEISDIRTDVDPTATSVYAFLKTAGSSPPAINDSGWIAGTWQTTTQQADTLWKTDAWFTLEANTYVPGAFDCYIWVDGSTYDPVRKAGTITIY